MTEGINGIGKPVTTGQSTRSEPSSPGTPGGPRQTLDSRSAGDSAVLTDSARMLQRLADSVAAGDAVDPSRAEAVRAAVSEGRYEVDSTEVARKLLAFDSDLGS
jgi:flagellar biosynthesis anti-sigma factor FlgM